MLKNATVPCLPNMFEMPKKNKPLSETDLQLWAKVAQTVNPLDPKERIALNDLLKQPVSRKEKLKAIPAQPSEPVKSQPVPRPIRGVTRLEQSAITKIAKGKIPLSGRIDLHGLTQREAYTRLQGFLASTSPDKGRYLLVITGKGKTDPESEYGILSAKPRGILRQALPQWIQYPPMNEFVSAYAEAHNTHGGSGAYYLRLRRRK